MRISDRRLIRQSLASFLFITLLGLFALGIYYRQASYSPPSQILGSEVIDTSPTPLTTITPTPQNK